MKTRLSCPKERGSVMVTTLVIAMLVGMLVAALLFVAQQQNYMTARARVWCSEIPLAEAGVEEAITHIVSNPADMEQNGWTDTGSTLYKTRFFTNGYFHTTIIPTSAETNTIISMGFARIPLQSGFSQRTVMAMVTKKQIDWGFVAKRDIVLNGNTYADSYISSDPMYSTDGMYDPDKKRDNCGMASISSLTPAIAAGACKIYGSAATGPGGTANGIIGDGTWIGAGNNTIQPGHFSDDFNMAIPDVAWPPTNWVPQFAPTKNQTNNGVVYEYIFTTGDWQLGASSPSGNGWLIKGNVRLFINGDFKSTLNGPSITIASNSVLELYLAGDMELGGQAVINPGGRTSSCLIYGLNTCTGIKYSGSAEAYARIYAPYAYVEISGGFDFSGSVVSDRMKFSGTSALHYDEALQVGVPQFRVVAWEEL